MAMSNWDTLAFNELGRPINGSFKSPSGVVVELYKNWLYVYDEKAWDDGGHFVRPCVMSINEGIVTYKDISIIAFRGPQNGIFACVWFGFDSNKDLKGMIGCGVYGYNDKGGWIGVTPETCEWLSKEINKKEKTFSEEEMKEFSSAEALSLRDSETYILDIPECFRGLNFKDGLRFNQGDAYFAKALEADIPATKVGESEEPILQSSIKKS